MAVRGEAATLMAELKGAGNTLGVLLIGETGSGKTTLVENLQLQSEEYSECVTVYDTSGLESARTAWSRIRNGGHDKWVIIFCIPLTETRMRASLIATFQEYHGMGINWSKTVFALTFADALPIPKTIRRDPNYNPALYFDQRTQEWQDHIRKVFREKICGDAIAAVKMFPTTGDSGDELPNGKEWFESAWYSIATTASGQAVMPSQSPFRKPRDWRMIFVISILTGAFLGLFVGGSIGTGIGAAGLSQGVNIGTSVGSLLGALAGALAGFGAAVAYRCYTSTREGELHTPILR